MRDFVSEHPFSKLAICLLFEEVLVSKISQPVKSRVPTSNSTLIRWSLRKILGQKALGCQFLMWEGYLQAENFLIVLGSWYKLSNQPSIYPIWIPSTIWATSTIYGTGRPGKLLFSVVVAGSARLLGAREAEILPDHKDVSPPYSVYVRFVVVFTLGAWEVRMLDAYFTTTVAQIVS